MSRYKPGQIFTVKGGVRFQVRKGTCHMCNIENDYCPPCMKVDTRLCTALIGLRCYLKPIKSCGKYERRS